MCVDEIVFLKYFRNNLKSKYVVYKSITTRSLNSKRNSSSEPKLNPNSNS